MAFLLFFFSLQLFVRLINCSAQKEKEDEGRGASFCELVSKEKREGEGERGDVVCRQTSRKKGPWRIEDARSFEQHHTFTICTAHGHTIGWINHSATIAYER